MTTSTNNTYIRSRSLDNFIHSEMINILTFCVFANAIDVKVYAEYGLITESLITNDLVITHGSKKLKFDIKLRYPQYEVIGDEKPCLARELLNNNNFDFDDIVRTANEEFLQVLDDQIAPHMNKATLHTDLINRNLKTREELHLLMQNLDLCQKGEIKCEMELINIPIMPTTRGYTRYKNQIYPCDPEEVFRTEQCSSVRDNSICCFLENNKNIGNCPGDVLEGPTSMAHHYIRQNTNLRIELPINDFKAVSIMDIEQFCYMLTKVTSKNGTVIYENKRNDPYEDPVDWDKIENNNAERINASRPRRFAARFWSEVKSGNNLNFNLEEVDLKNAPMSELKTKLEHSEQKVVKIFGDREEMSDLRTSLCQFTGMFKANDLLHALTTTRAILESKVERIATECEQLPVPHIIPIDLIRRLCRVFVDNSICIDDQVRNLFNCKMQGTSLDDSAITLRIELDFSLPINDDFEGLRMFAMPKYINTNTFTEQENVTLSKSNTVDKPEQKSDMEVLKDILNKISNSRKRRNLVKLHHNIKLNSMPEIAAKHKDDLILFREVNCRKLKNLYICPYENNDNHASQCVSSLISGNTKAVQQICSFEMYKTESECEQRKTSYGFIISTSEKISLNPVKNTDTVFTHEVVPYCSDICFIPHGKSGASFQCNNRNYILESIETKVNVSYIKTDKLNLYELKDGVSGISETLKTDLKKVNWFLNKTHVNSRDLNTATVLSAGIIGVASFLFGTKRALMGGKMLAHLILKYKESSRKKFAKTNEGYATYLKLKELQRRNEMCA